MARKPDKVDGPGKPGPVDRQEMRDRLSNEFLVIFSEPVREAALRLFDDPRMKPLWDAGLTEATVFEAALAYWNALNRDAWASKPQRARYEWLAKFEKTVDTLLELMEEGPHPPYQWGFPARDNVLMNVAHRMGIELPEAGTDEFFREMHRLEHAADAEDWTIADALKHYREQQRVDAKVTQVLKKPGDPMAGRAEFFYWVGKCKISDDHLGILWCVMSGEEVIDDRQVRRNRRPRRTDS